MAVPGYSPSPPQTTELPLTRNGCFCGCQLVASTSSGGANHHCTMKAPPPCPSTPPPPTTTTTLVGENSTCSVRHCRDARVYGHTTTAMHDSQYEYTPHHPVPTLHSPRWSGSLLRILLYNIKKYLQRFAVLLLYSSTTIILRFPRLFVSTIIYISTVVYTSSRICRCVAAVAALLMGWFSLPRPSNNSLPILGTWSTQTMSVRNVALHELHPPFGNSRFTQL